MLNPSDSTGLVYNKVMNKCNCTAGQVASPAPYNRATNCETMQEDCGLRTIVIPKTKGSDAKDQPYAPQLGANRNAIVIYEATGAIYIYDNNGVFTNFTGSSITPVLEAIQAQVDAATQAVGTMQTELASEISTRISADTALQNTINSLETALNTEVATRSSDVQALQNALNALKAEVNAMAGSTTEREERIAADEQLQEQITALQTATEGLVKTDDLKTINGISIVGTGDIELSIPELSVVQTTGDSETQVMSQKAVTEALASAGNGITSATLTGNDTDNQLTVSTSGPTPDSSSVSLKTVNGQSLIGTGDIPVSGGGSATTANAHIESLTTGSDAPITLEAGASGSSVLLGGRISSKGTLLLITGEFVPTSQLPTSYKPVTVQVAQTDDSQHPGAMAVAVKLYNPNDEPVSGYVRGLAIGTAKTISS